MISLMCRRVLHPDSLFFIQENVTGRMVLVLLESFVFASAWDVHLNAVNISCVK